jgi:hypothetical protein
VPASSSPLAAPAVGRRIAARRTTLCCLLPHNPGRRGLLPHSGNVVPPPAAATLLRMVVRSRATPRSCLRALACRTTGPCGVFTASNARHILKCVERLNGVAITQCKPPAAPPKNTGTHAVVLSSHLISLWCV